MQAAPTLQSMTDEELFPRAIRLRSTAASARSETEQAALDEITAELRRRGYRFAQVGAGRGRKIIIAPIRR